MGLAIGVPRILQWGVHRGGYRNFLIGAERGLRNGSPPAESRGKAPAAGPGDKVPQKLMQTVKFVNNF